MSQEVYEQRKKMISTSLPLLPPMLTTAMAELNLEKLNSEIEDGRWREWYEHFHQLVLFRSERDAFYHVRIGLNSNMEAAGLYVLVSALLIPAIRHWWCIVPACGWAILFLAETYSGFSNYGNRWSTMFEQINYLSKARAIGGK
ncbi:MAG TPA: hypothetical protein VJO35_04950 [Terriglobales bacterium]|nr:hypothetical protein [Terriglobales bacterium]